MFTCFSKEGTYLVYGKASVPPVWAPTERVTVTHHDSVSVRHLRTLELHESNLRHISASHCSGFLAAFKAATQHHVGELVVCPACLEVVRRGGLATHRKGINCIAGANKHAMTRADRVEISDYAERDRIPAHLFTMTQFVGNVREGKKKVERLVDVHTAASWVHDMVKDLDSDAECADYACAALRALGAHDLQDRRTYASPWREVALRMLKDMVRDMAATAAEDASERDFIASLLATDRTALQAYVVHRAPQIAVAAYAANVETVRDTLSRRGNW